MKKVITITFFISIICIIALTFRKKNNYKETIQTIQEIPEFEFYSIKEGEMFSKKTLANDKATILLYFNSHCDICTHELEELNSIIEELLAYNIVLFSFQDIDTINRFITNYQFNNFDNFFIGRIDYQIIYEWFGSISPPAVYIYNKNEKLISFHFTPFDIKNLLMTFAKDKNETD